MVIFVSKINSKFDENEDECSSVNRGHQVSGIVLYTYEKLKSKVTKKNDGDDLTL